MKIKYSALVMGVSGKLNGSVGATNKGGAYLRNKGVVRNPNTEAQQLVRSRFGSLSSQFRGLTPAQISAWNAAAPNFPIIDRLGDTRFLSGLGLFVQLNTNLLSAGLSIIENPPAKQVFPSVHDLEFIASAAEDILYITNAFEPAALAGQFVAIYRTSPMHSPSVTNVKNQMRQLTTSAVAAGSSKSLDITAPYLAKYGALTVGQAITLEIVLVSVISGEASVPASKSRIITPTE